MVGDLVTLSASKSAVKQSLAAHNYGWVDKMREMLGKNFKILEILRDGIIALPSPNGQQGGKWYFHQDVVTKATGKMSKILYLNIA